MNSSKICLPFNEVSLFVNEGREIKQYTLEMVYIHPGGKGFYCLPPEVNHVGNDDLGYNLRVPRGRGSPW